MVWDVTVPDSYAESHIANTATTPGVAVCHTWYGITVTLTITEKTVTGITLVADHTAALKKAKYR